MRARRPTDETGTEVYTPERRRALFGASPGERIASASESWEQDATDVSARSGPAVEQATPTHIDGELPTPVASAPTPVAAAMPAEAAMPGEQATPTEIAARPERPAANLPNGERPAANLPNGERPAANLPNGERPAANLPNGERPAANLPNGERSEPIRVISMKNRARSEPRADEPRVPLHVQLRSMAEVAGMRGPAAGLGHLAPPRDPQQARKRRQHDNVVWACAAIILACAISLGIWLIAGR